MEWVHMNFKNRNWFLTHVIFWIHCPRIIFQWSCLPFSHYSLSHMKSTHNLPTIPLKRRTNIWVYHLPIRRYANSHTTALSNRSQNYYGPIFYMNILVLVFKKKKLFKDTEKDLVVSNTILAITGTYELICGDDVTFW